MIWAGIAVIVAFYVACIIATLIHCLPADQQLPSADPSKWAERAAKNHCQAPEINVAMIQGVFSAATDLYGEAEL